MIEYGGLRQEHAHKSISWKGVYVAITLVYVSVCVCVCVLVCVDQFI